MIIFFRERKRQRETKINISKINKINDKLIKEIIESMTSNKILKKTFG